MRMNSWVLCLAMLVTSVGCKFNFANQKSEGKNDSLPANQSTLCEQKTTNGQPNPIANELVVKIVIDPLAKSNASQDDLIRLFDPKQIQSKPNIKFESSWVAEDSAGRVEISRIGLDTVDECPLPKLFFKAMSALLPTFPNSKNLLSTAQLNEPWSPLNEIKNRGLYWYSSCNLQNSSARFGELAASFFMTELGVLTPRVQLGRLSVEISGHKSEIPGLWVEDVGTMCAERGLVHKTISKNEPISYDEGLPSKLVQLRLARSWIGDDDVSFEGEKGKLTAVHNTEICVNSSGQATEAVGIDLEKSFFADVPVKVESQIYRKPSHTLISNRLLTLFVSLERIPFAEMNAGNPAYAEMLESVEGVRTQMAARIPCAKQKLNEIVLQMPFSNSKQLSLYYSKFIDLLISREK